MSETPAIASVRTLASFSGILQYAYVLLAVICLNFIEAGGHDQQRALELVLLCLAGLALAGRPALVPLPCRETLFPLSVFFGLGIISSALSFAPRYGFYETSSMLLLLLVGLAAAGRMSSDGTMIPRVLQVFGVVAALYTVKIIVVYVSVWLLDTVPEPGDFTPGFSNIRHFNHAETVGLPLLALLYARSPQASAMRALALIPAAAWWAVLLATGGRGTALGLLAGAIAAVVLRRGAAWPYLRALLIACLTGVLVYFLFFVLLPLMAGRLPFGEAGSLVHRTVADPSSGRTVLWSYALQLIAAHPWLGVGPLHFAHEGASLQLGAHPHDWMLQIAVEWGLPALLAACAAIFFSARAMWRAGRSLAPADTANQNMFSAWLLIGTAVVVDGLVSGNLVMPQSQLMIVLYLACATGWTGAMASARATNISSRYPVRILALSAAVTLWWTVAPQFIDKAMENESVSTVKAPSDPWPRLWRDGYF